MYQQQQSYNYYPQQPQVMRMPQQPQVIGLKGRPVSSLEEVRAIPVDFDGSIFYFPSLANDKIYTKQINLDGTSSLKVYELKELPLQDTSLSTQGLVTKEEFTMTINNLLEEISALKELAGTTALTEMEEQSMQQPQSTFNF